MLGRQLAAELVGTDVLHPEGVTGVLEQSSELLSDPTLARRLGPPSLPRPEGAVPPIDVGAMDRLLVDRFSAAQRRFLHRLRQLLEARDG